MKNSPEPKFEELPDAEKRRIALERDQQVRSLLDSLKNREKQVIHNLAGLFGVPGEEDWKKVAWSGIVVLANVTMDDPNSRELGLIYFKHLTSLCAWHLSEDITNSAQELDCFRDVEIGAKLGKKSLGEVFTEKACAAQKQLRIVLHWLADPKACGKEARSWALRFLLENSSESAIEYDIEPNDEFDENGHGGYPLFYWKRILGYGSVISPVAKFIVDQLELYHADGSRLADVVPIIICNRAGCGRFSVSRRRTRRFCSDSCRALHRQKTKREAWAAYMRKYRADNY